MKIIAMGKISVYPRDGAYQLYCTCMVLDGIGDLYAAFEQLKEKLSKQGLFDPVHKKQLPQYPGTIGIITSSAGAAIHDMLRILRKRYPLTRVRLLPVRVQGAGAAEEIAAALRKAGKRNDIDVIIVGRGGGSMEDLWAFNEEIVVRAIAECPVPVVSAVGHETDVTLSDFAADVRASTPSNAAEIVVPDRSELLLTIAALRRQLQRQAETAAERAQQRILHARMRLNAASPERKYDALTMKLQAARAALNSAVDARMTAVQPRLAMAALRLDSAADKRLERSAARLDPMRARLEAVMPLRVLDRGYAMVSHEGRVISTAEAAKSVHEMKLTFRDGSVRVIRQEDETNGSEEKARL